METKDIDKIDIAIANLIFSGLSLEKIEKIPDWLLKNIENNKPEFRDTITKHHQNELEKAAEAERERCVGIVENFAIYTPEEQADIERNELLEEIKEDIRDARVLPIGDNGKYITN